MPRRPAAFPAPYREQIIRPSRERPRGPPFHPPCLRTCRVERQFGAPEHVRQSAAVACALASFGGTQRMPVPRRAGIVTAVASR